MNTETLKLYEKIRETKQAAFYAQARGLIAVWGKEAVNFLNGLITNDVAKLEDGAQMPAAFPNAQGRLLAVVRVMRKGEKFLFETEDATREKVFQNLFRFTFAGEFFVEDLSEKYKFISVLNFKDQKPKTEEQTIEFQTNFGTDYFVPDESAEDFLNELKNQNAVEISDELYEVLRIENGVPLYGTDMDETTIVPELGIENLISYNKGCYIGQEIIARIYFRGHVAKQMRGLIFDENETGNTRVSKGENELELKSAEGKNAGKITSITFSPKLGKTISLAFVRYEFLAEGTKLKLGDADAEVINLPFLK